MTNHPPSHPRQIDRHDFAAYVLLWRERFGGTRREAFDAVAVALDGWLLHPFASADALRVWISDGDRSEEIFARKLRIELENRHNVVFDAPDRALDGGPPPDGEGVGGGAPRAGGEGLTHTTRREMRRFNRAERERFIADTVATLTTEVERNPAYIAVIIRKYAEALAT